jgi:hypothetical protein
VRTGSALEALATGALRRIAAAHGLAVDDGTTRADLVDRLLERLSSTRYLSDFIASLPRDEQEALRAARASNGEIRGFLLDRDHPGAAEALVERGLLFRTFSVAGPRRGEVFALSDEMRELLPGPPPAELPPMLAEARIAERRATDPAFSLFALTSTLQRPGSDVHKEVEGWSEEPAGWDHQARWSFLRHIAHESGLLVAHGSAPLGPAPSLPRLLNDHPALAERLRRTYLHDHGWSDLAEAGVEGALELADATLVRAPVVQAVERLPTASWVDFRAFAEWLRGTNPEVLREQLDARGRLLLESVGWDQLEVRLMRYIVLGPLYWLGIVAITGDGSAFARREPARPQQPEPCTWETATELVAPVRAELGTLLEAERYLVLESRGRPSRYRLLQQHVAAALGSGGSIADCRRLLLRLTQAKLPEVVEERLAAWTERFGALSVRPAVLLEARSAEDLDSVLGDDAVKGFVQRRLGPAVAEVAAADALELAAVLRASGDMPRVDAALRLSAEPRRAYATMIDEQVLEFLLVSLLAFQHARPERLAELEGASSLLQRLQRQFAPERLRELRAAAQHLAGELRAMPPPSRAPRSRRRRRA